MYFTCSFKEQKRQTHLKVFRLPAFKMSGISGKENNLYLLGNVFYDNIYSFLIYYLRNNNN